MPTVLLIEDDEPFAEMLSVVIRQQGFEVELAGTVRAARDLLAANKYAAIVLDFGLPDGDAHDVLPLLGDPPSAPVLVVSADRDIHRRLSSAPVRRIFSKPLDTRAFRAELRGLANTC